MRILDRYIGLNLMKSYLLVMLILVSLFSFLRLVEELGDLSADRYQIADALLYVVLTIPQQALDLLSITALLGSILGLGVLAGTNELNAMRAAGVSVRRIGWSTIKTGLIIIALAGLLMEFAVPPLSQYAHAKRLLATSGAVAMRTGQGFWSRDGNRFINVRDILGGRTPANIDIYEFGDNGRLRHFLHAARADIHTRQQWVLLDVTEKTFRADQIASRHHVRLRWKSFLSASQVGIIVSPPATLSPSDLYRYVQGLKRRGENAARAELTLWQKLSLPPATAVMILLSIPFVFGSSRTVTTAARIVVGSIIGILFYLTNQITGYLALLLQIDPVVAVAMPLLVMSIIAIWLLRRIW